MDIILYLSIFYTLYGIAGIFGFQLKIPNKFKGHTWTKDYIRKQGISWLILGIPWLIFYVLIHKNRLEFFYELIILIACALPSIKFSIFINKKYEALLKKQ